MVAVPIPHPGRLAPQTAPASSLKPQDWTHFLAAGTLIAGGVLMATGQRKAGLAVAATGTALALYEEREAVQTLWHNLPGYLNQAQTMLDRAEGYMNEAIAQGHKLQDMLHR